MISAKLEYEKGNFEPILASAKETDSNLKLFALLFQCEPSHIFEQLQYYLGMLESSQQKARLLILKCMQLHTISQHDIASQQLKHIPKNSYLTGEMDDFYLSTHRYLSALDDIGPVDKFSPEINFSIIGDSHIISMLNGVEFQPGYATYLPGITLRGLSNPIDNSYKAALRNAMAMHQRKDHLIFSIGEIDQRVSYKKAIKNTKKNYKAYLHSLLQVVDNAIDYLESLRAPYQELYVMALPSFDANLIDADQLTKENLTLVSDHVAKYSENFHNKCRSSGISILGESELQNCDIHSHLLDHAHFNPGIYRTIFSKI